MKKDLILLMTAIVFAGCTNPRFSADMSSGAIGCQPDDIIIENESSTLIAGLHTWEAVCNGRRYICSYQVSTGVNCKEEFEATMLSSLKPNIMKTNGIYEAYDNGIVWNTKRDLEWKAGPNRDTNWDMACSWVETLRLGGGGWRMPTMNELEGLYQKGTGNRNMTPLLKTTGWGVWSGETRGSGDAEYFFFDTNAGGRYWYSRDGGAGMRAFAVRSRSKGR